MAELMFGLETEYAISRIDKNGKALNRHECNLELAKLVSRVVPCAAGMGSPTDYFLGNGGRYYIDCGDHPEYATPECTSPDELIAHSRAGDQLLTETAEKLESNDPQGAKVLVTKCNVDYTDSRSTWGSHESYLHRVQNCDVLSEQLIPHLVSRIIYTGAGGFDSCSPGLRFMLSPRVRHLSKVSSSESTYSRGIFHTKDESLCGKGYKRLHALCGESLCSQSAEYLRFGATALIVALINAGKLPGDECQLSAPLIAMEVFSLDQGCTAVAKLASGEMKRAIDIQRHYLQRVEQCLGSKFFPPWAEQCCRSWREVLDAIDQSPDSLSTSLDWAIKRELFIQHAKRFEIDWGMLPFWTRIMIDINSALDADDSRDIVINYRNLSRQSATGSGLKMMVREISKRLKSNNLYLEQIDNFIALRNELHEIDLRFGQLGTSGIFGWLDRAGSLHHRRVSSADIASATTTPPALGRARLRGGAISKSSHRSSLLSYWDRLVDTKRGQVLDLSDPWEARKECWSEVKA
jgi:proteasome accessory factor A